MEDRPLPQPFQPQPTDLLVVVDVQTDFLPGGALAVPHGDAVIPVVNRLATRFAHVICTQDWHPPGHASFASTHPGRTAFDTIALPYGPQVLWPDHCVQGTPGAALAEGLELPGAELVIRKGFHASIDSYSAFAEADGSTTGLAAYARARGFTRIVLCGLATDYCVGWSALDARREGFAVALVEDGCRGIDLGGSLVTAWAAMDAAGVTRLVSEDLD